MPSFFQNTFERFEKLKDGASGGRGAWGVGRGAVFGVSPTSDVPRPTPRLYSHSLGFLSSRKRRNTGCRSNPSFVRSLNRTSATRVGSTHISSRPFGAGPSHG